MDAKHSLPGVAKHPSLLGAWALRSRLQNLSHHAVKTEACAACMRTFATQDAASARKPSQ